MFLTHLVTMLFVAAAPDQAAAAVPGKPAEVGSAVGTRAPAIQLQDTTGRVVTWEEFAGAKAIAVVFLGTECPMVRLYAARLEDLSREFAPRGVRFVGINANHQDTAAEIAAFAADNALTFPLLRDEGQKVADGFGARRTPEVFLLDSDRNVRYHGRIDDQYLVGIQKPKPSRRDLALAIGELLDGKEVSQAELPATGCLIGRTPAKTSTAPITFSNQVSRILQARCADCHRAGEIAPFSVTSYSDVAGWGETILEVVEGGRMPPWFASPEHGHFANDPRLSEEEKQTLRDWVAASCPEGDPADLPSPRVFTAGWNIPEPDVVYPMGDEPFHVPAEGVIDYKHFVIDPGFTEDKWVVACEARPGERAVVHHILVFLQPPGQRVELMNGALLAAYAPGSPPRALPKGMAKRIPAGSRIIMQIHYTVCGKPKQDLSSVGLVFCDAEEVTQPVESGWAINFLFAIPPRASAHPVFSLHRFKEDRILYDLTPHMHLRGKSFRYEAHYPDGTKEILLDVPRYDFNWQIEYVLAEPKPMPKGTELRCYATYDNSSGNPANPNPDTWVRFGDQTWEEMMIGWFIAAAPPKGASQAVSQASN